MIHINDYKFKNSQSESLNLVGKVKVKLLIVLAFVVIASFFTQLVFAGNLAVGGQKLSEVENEIEKLEAENTTLKIENKYGEEKRILKLPQAASFAF